MPAPADPSAPGGILVIKLSALGDFIQAFGPFAAIRAAHPDLPVTLLTTAPFAGLAHRAPWFDHVWVDERPRWHQFRRILSLRARLRGGRFRRVYDLQTSDRSGFYFRLMGGPGRVEWSGIAPGCSHPHANPKRDFMHSMDRQAEQLRMAGIAEVPAPDLAWMEEDVSAILPGGRFALLAPGGAPHRMDKRWPLDRYAALGRALLERGLTPLILGSAAEIDEHRRILADCPRAASLAGVTSLGQIAALARRAVLAIGNDTGPMHIVSLSGCPSTVLYSHASDPALCAQRGPAVTILRRPSLTELALEEVLAALPPA